MTIKDSLRAEFDHETATTRKLLERIPDEKLSWKPHEKSMTLGGLATHLANLPWWAVSIMNERFFDVAAGPPRNDAKASRAEILAAFDETTKQARAGMDKTDAEYLVPWALKRGDQEMFSMPRVTVFRTFVLYHMVHHRGQLSVYLRLNDVPVPPMYGPTADEG